MTSTLIVARLAKEFSIQPEQIKSSLEMIDARLAAPFIGRVRRETTGGLSEGVVRHLARRREELEELDRRRGTILRMLQGPAGRSDTAEPSAAGGEAPAGQAPAGEAPAEGAVAETASKQSLGSEGVAFSKVPASVVERVKTCMERFELEDLFLPHRRPEPEVQLALDRGLGALADHLVSPVPAERVHKVRAAAMEATAEGAPAELASPAQAAAAAEPTAEAASAPTADAAAAPTAEAVAEPTAEPTAEAAAESTAEAAAESTAEAAAEPTAEAAAEPTAEAVAQPTAEAVAEPTSEAAAESTAEAAAAPTAEAAAEPTAEAAAAPTADAAAAPTAGAAAEEPQGTQAAPEEGRSQGAEGTREPRAGGAQGARSKSRKKSGGPTPEELREEAALEALLHGQIELTPELARACTQYVSPDRGIHTEADALAGAMRILSDRLGRDTRLRGQIRRLLGKQGVLSVRPMVEEKRLGRHKALLKLKQPLRQVQGHRLLAIRQAQKERALSTAITLDRRQALPKVRAALGKHTDPAFASVLDAIALRTLEHRLLPLLEADVRLELKERADEEALRFLAQHLRQVLLTPPLGPRPVAGLDVNAKGDWTLALLGEDGEVQGEVVRIEPAEKDDATLAAELAAALRPTGGSAPAAVALGHGKGPRSALLRLRGLLQAAGLETVALPVNESGLSSYASSELARKELTDLTVPQRMAVSLGRRLQDPMNEILKIDPRHLGLGPEQGLVSKANLRRTFDETIESCTAHVGCEVNRAPFSLLSKIPGLDAEVAARLIERRAQRPFESREELRSEGLLSEAQWITSVSFLRVKGSSEPLDATSLHPEQYPLARRMIESTGGSVEDSLGKPGVTKGLRRTDFGVEEHVWRDMMRELWHPGRDPRPGLFRPEFLDPKADPITLTKGRVVEGVVSNVASFGAFVYVGLESDAMIHVSEISKRYVRDARELVSIGQTLRASIKEAGGQRLSLSLKDLPDVPREGGGPRREHRGGRRPAERRPGGPRREREPAVPVRAAQSRRDGLGGRGGGKGRGGRPGGAGGRGGGAGGRGRGGDRNRRDAGERVHPDDLRAISGSTAYNPFATFFKKEPEEQSPGKEAGSEASGKETSPPE